MTRSCSDRIGPPTSWDASWLSGKHAEERLDAVFEHMQRGLVYPSPYAIFAIFWCKDQCAYPKKEQLRDLMVAIRAKVTTYGDCKNTTAILGVSFDLWKEWQKTTTVEGPQAIRSTEPGKVQRIFSDSSPFADSGGDLWFHIKSDRKDYVEDVHKFITDWLNNLGCIKPEHHHTLGVSRPLEEVNGCPQGRGKVIGRRFSENLNNPSDPVSIAESVVVGYDDWEHLGASVVLGQRFVLNWERLHSLGPSAIENLVGRKVGDTIIPTNDTASHIKAARVRDEYGDTRSILRLGLPFGRSKYTGRPSLINTGVNAGDEEGIFYVGYTKSVGVFDEILQSMLGDTPGYIRDRLLNNAKADQGGFFYIPSVKDMGMDLTIWDKRSEAWEDFPGVDWTRLDRHFKNASENGFMFYNHKDYLFRMATRLGLKDAYKDAAYQPPSLRVIALLANSFSRWQDNWYFDRKQEEMPDLKAVLTEHFSPEEAARVMKLSVVERKGWASKMTLKLLSSDKYGFRGLRTVDAKEISGSDTYRLHPYELIVGGMPNLSLSQGSYCMKYLSDAERDNAFLKTLSEASGVGHVVPDHSVVLNMGLGKLIQKVKDMQQVAKGKGDTAKVQFYEGVVLALEGVQDWSKSYAELAQKRANKMKEGQKAERENLEGIAKRMNKLAAEPPSTFLEAAQLVYTMHCCLHCLGEPTPLGRLDQLLGRFYDSDNITFDEAQEIIDCLWVKLDEKVQWNRLNIEDHQADGYLAMGGSSGPYPKGGATNQWIQQCTVGGCVADNNEKATLAYNDVTKLCLRSAGRLPLNAPCLSLRVCKEMPKEYLEEAAKAILSGGAHPILLNDDKLIPGLQQSGDHIGEGCSFWNSKVELKSARNYACDGCYEPQLSGENWFTLGGFSALDPLECALNQGKTYASAGPGWYKGKLTSFFSEAPGAIKKYSQLESLYLKHFEYLFLREINGQLGTYGAAGGVCPSPLLSALVHPCLEKGRDYYDGGPRYNIYGPCFFGLPSAINSLFAIKTLVFDEQTAVTSLPELVTALLCDWGHKMVEPFVSSLAGPAQIAIQSHRYQELREFALKLPKFGRGIEEIDTFGHNIISHVVNLTYKVFREPVPATAALLKGLSEKYGSEDFPFGVQIQPGVGNFENFVENGAESGASADGRRNGETISSDLSATPSPMDRAPEHQPAKFLEALKGMTADWNSKMCDGAPTDFNIAETFPLECLTEVLKKFAGGEGSNVLTVTCASPKTFARAKNEPEQYDLLRCRMGGWTEFFTSMFPDKQDQHARRPLSEPHS